MLKVSTFRLIVRIITNLKCMCNACVDNSNVSASRIPLNKVRCKTHSIIWRRDVAHVFSSAHIVMIRFMVTVAYKVRAKNVCRAHRASDANKHVHVQNKCVYNEIGRRTKETYTYIHIHDVGGCETTNIGRKVIRRLRPSSINTKPSPVASQH